MSDVTPAMPATPDDPEVYRPHIGTVFSIDASPEPVALTLAGVDDVGVLAGTRQFSLLFHGAQLVPAGTYVLRHDALGPVLLFITPIRGSTRERIIYQACFNLTKL
jgi:hypothetical protein